MNGIHEISRENRSRFENSVRCRLTYLIKAVVEGLGDRLGYAVAAERVTVERQPVIIN